MEFEKIIRLVEAVSASALTGFTLEENGTRLVLEKKPETAAGSPAFLAAQTASAGSLEGLSVIKSVPAMQAADPAAFPTGAGSAAMQPPAGADSAAMQAPVETGAFAAAAECGAVSEEMIVKAPLVGTFYSAPSEEAEPFVSVGDVVKKGQVLGIIEAMKLMNEIESEYDGVVEAILISNEQVVEYGQPLFRIRRKG